MNSVVNQTVAVVDYGMGNLRSVAQAVIHATTDTHVNAVITSDPQVVRNAHRVVLPGQGAMADCMRELRESGLLESVLEAAASKPLFGVCVGMQMLLDHSEEGHTAEGTPGLGLIVVAAALLLLLLLRRAVPTISSSFGLGAGVDVRGRTVEIPAGGRSAAVEAGARPRVIAPWWTIPTGTLSPRVGDVHHQPSAFEILVPQRDDGAVGGLGAAHGDEAEAPRATIWTRG